MTLSLGHLLPKFQGHPYPPNLVGACQMTSMREFRRANTGCSFTVGSIHPGYEFYCSGNVAPCGQLPPHKLFTPRGNQARAKNLKMLIFLSKNG